MPAYYIQICTCSSVHRSTVHHLHVKASPNQIYQYDRCYLLCAKYALEDLNGNDNLERAFSTLEHHD
jgi:hypothetical protein